MPNIKINDIDIYYELHGIGQPLVLISGYACDHAFWTVMMSKLITRFQVLIFDNRAVGQTKDDGSPFKLDLLAEDVMGLVHQLGLIQPHIVGHSMGGAIAQIIAKKYPNEINKMIILNSAATFNIRTIKALESMLNLRKANVPFDLLIETCMPWLFSSGYLAKPENILSFKESVMNNLYLQSMKDQERQFNAIVDFDSRSWLNELKTESLIISSTEDILDLPTEGQELKENILQAEFKLIPGGHSSPIEQPHEVCELIFNFLG